MKLGKICRLSGNYNEARISFRITIFPLKNSLGKVICNCLVESGRKWLNVSYSIYSFIHKYMCMCSVYMGQFYIFSINTLITTFLFTFHFGKVNVPNLIQI